ncbi:LuxR family two component transcriptional regulator [Gillisia sp. Hel_I_86]|uniref:response regulator n=1 Tax=Gillisia sp. Hel_I_86 TaxID=1249981 RepID=UPI00119C7DAF|nr:response regulator transcription factor [Gillisia sp. Hel_I_86]TVZ25292.1 LuxR family two component transcriptional regulator [Gillisia sp. Hel_I_86]
MKKTIIIVDDHTLFAQSLQGLVNSFQEYEVLAILKNGKELVHYFDANHKRPDILLLDIRMPIKDGIDTMAWLKEHFPEQKTLALTMEHDEEIIIKMVRLGCRGYLLKDIEPEEFLYALQSVATSGYYFSKEIEEVLDHPATKKYGDLSTREMEFLNYACSEKTYKEVAEEMNLSPKTIDGYRESLFSKLRVKSRVGMVLFAVKNGIVKI